MKRPFHPLHRQTPFDGSRIESRRTLVLWCHGEKHIRTDDWREGTECPMPPEETWVDYTFFKDLTAPGTGETMESSSTPPQVSGTSSFLTSSSGPPSLPKAAGIPSPEALVTPVPESEELIREVRYVRRGTTGSSSSSSAQSKALARGRTAVESHLGYLSRLEGQERRGELLRDLPNPMEEREDWEEPLRAEALVPSPDEVPTWMGIATQMPRRPAGSREGYGMVGAPKAAADRPLPGEDSESDDEFEFLEFLGVWLMKSTQHKTTGVPPFSFLHFASSMMSQVALNTKAFALIWLKKRTA